MRCDISFISQLLPLPIVKAITIRVNHRVLHIAGFWISRNWDLRPADDLGQPVRLHQSRGASHYQPHPAGDSGQHETEKEQEEKEKEKEKSAGTICGGCWTTREVEEGSEWGSSTAQHWAQSGLAVWRPKYVTTSSLCSLASHYISHRNFLKLRLQSRLRNFHWGTKSIKEQQAGELFVTIPV